jgi:hypothetical protein
MCNLPHGVCVGNVPNLLHALCEEGCCVGCVRGFGVQLNSFQRNPNGLAVFPYETGINLMQSLLGRLL